MGAKLDTVADILFVVAAAYKLLPVLEISKSIWIWIGVIAVNQKGLLVWTGMTESK